MHKSKIKTSKHISYVIMHNLLIQKITKDINKTRPDVVLMYLFNIHEMIMAMALTSVLKLASTKYILSLYSKQ